MKLLRRKNPKWPHLGRYRHDVPSYHDLHITTADIPRASIFNLPYGLEVSCTRTTGWRLIQGARVLGGEYDEPDNWLVLDVDGHVIADSRRIEKDDGE